MTLDELNDHLFLLQELTSARELLSRLQAAALSSSKFDYTPHTQGITDKTAALAIRISAQREVVAQYEQIVEDSSRSVKAFVDSIPDNRTNVIFYLRFICGYDWQSVAAIVGCSVDGVKSLVYRFFRSQPK